MKKLRVIDWLALLFVIIGGLNWAMYGLFNFDLVAFIFGPMTLLSRVVYVIVGLAAIYLIFSFPRSEEEIKKVVEDEVDKDFRI